MSCAEAVRRLWEFLDGDLDAHDAGRIERHLAFCRRCCGELEFAEALRELLQSASSPHLPLTVEARLTGFLEALDDGTV